MSRELEAVEYLKENKRRHWLNNDKSQECLDIIETTLKDYENLKEENKLLRENIENLDETYFDTWYACERLKKE